MLRKWLILICLCIVPASAAAQRAYVADNIRLNLRPQPSVQVAPVGVVVSSDVLTVVEQVSGYLRVRTEDGREGWVNRDYISVDDDNAGAELIVAVSDPAPEVQLPQAGISPQLQERPSVSGGMILSWILATLLFTAAGFAAGLFYDRWQIVRRLGGFRLSALV